MNLQYGFVSSLPMFKSSISARFTHETKFPAMEYRLDDHRKSLISRRVFVRVSSRSDSLSKLKRYAGSPIAKDDDGLVSFRGKSGSISFHGLTHQRIEERKLISAPFVEENGSYLWVLAPVALIASLILPQFFLGPILDSVFKDEFFLELATSLSSDAVFYVGLATFLVVADLVQRPYLEFSPKRWSLITGLRGYLSSAFFTTGLKVVAPIFAVYVTWPVLGLPALIAVVPYLVGFAAQRFLEILLDKRGSSCWPLVPIIFEIYRLYQLTKGAHLIQRLLFSLSSLPESPQLVERSNALISMAVVFQVVGLLCLWSLVTFLLRLFPSRPVVENY